MLYEQFRPLWITIEHQKKDTYQWRLPSWFFLLFLNGQGLSNKTGKNVTAFWIKASPKIARAMGEVDRGRLGPWARLIMVHLALSVVDLARSAHLTFLDLSEHWFNVFIWGARAALAHLCPYTRTVLSKHNSASLCTLSPRPFQIQLGPSVPS